MVVESHSNLSVKVPGDLGVSAFFVLSGFLITRLLIREHDKTGSVSLSKFYLRRTMRIFPAYYAFLILSYILDAHAGQVWSSTVLASALTYTVNYFNAFNSHPATSIAHAWSLAVEEQFYVLWPLAFLILASRGKRALAIGLSVAALGALLWRTELFLVAHASVAYVYNAFDTRLDNLAVGCLLALAVDHQRAIAFASRLARRAWFPAVTVGLLLVSRLWIGEAYHYSVGFTVDAILVAVLIAQLLQLYQSRAWHWLEWKVVKYLGAISYPIYLYHAWGASLGRRVHGLEFVAGVVATVALASGSYYVVERPFLKLKARFAAQSSPSPVASPRGSLLGSVFLTSGVGPPQNGQSTLR